LRCRDTGRDVDAERQRHRLSETVTHREAKRQTEIEMQIDRDRGAEKQTE
jgi:hypothetical protein